MKGYLDRVPNGWSVLDVMRKESRRWEWVALIVDVPPEDLKHCQCKTAFLYVDPTEYKPGDRIAHEAWVSIPGKHENRDAAWEALEDTIATRY